MFSLGVKDKTLQLLQIIQQHKSHHLTSLILMTAEWPILCTATTLSPRWQYLSCFATDMAACMLYTLSISASSITHPIFSSRKYWQAVWRQGAMPVRMH